MKFSSLNKIVVLFLISFVSLKLNAQNMINDDFLDNIEENVKPFLLEDDSAFKSNTIPEKYKNESAVILGFQRSVSFDKKFHFGLNTSKGKLALIEKARFKIKLNDRNSVKAFSELYFRYKEKTDGFTVRITKQNAVVESVSLSSAVSVDHVSDVPEFFKSFFDKELEKFLRENNHTGAINRLESGYYKVAVSNLEPGDVLEYVAFTKTNWDLDGFGGYLEFSPHYELCSKVYPILFNRISIETDSRSFFKALSVNGAPEFKKVATGDDNLYKYVFTDYDRNVEKDINFINTYRLYPLAKFQIIYSYNEKVKGALIGRVGEIKSNFTKEELARKAWEDYENVGDIIYTYPFLKVQGFIDNTYQELKKQGAKDWSEKEYINNVYYKLRNVVINRDDYLSDKVAAYIFGSLLFQKNIKSELVICVSNSIGKMDNVLFGEEIRYVCKVGNSYYFNWTDHSNPSDLVESLLGSEAYIIEAPVKKQNTQTIKPIVLPDAGFQDNISDYTMNVSLAADMNTISVSRISSFVGISKTRNIESALKFTPYMIDDYKYYGGEDPTDKMRQAQQDEYFNAVKALKDEFKEAKVELVKKDLQSEFHQKVKYKNFAISSDGRSTKANKLTFTEEFELPGMVRKAGKKYLVNIVGLVGSQLQIKKDERTRNHDINVGYARTLNWVINFKIPDGYTVEGIKELKTNVDNETGTYSCDAEETNGSVTIKVKKVYKNANTAKDKWSSMLAFIDAAYNNSFKYLLLKPKN